MNILDEIIAHKKKLVAERKEMYPLKLLEKSIFYDTPVVSMKKYLTRPKSTGIIAEFKRKSPSEGFINEYASIEQVSLGYMQSGAAALSVLTDEKYFGGTDKDLIAARNLNYCPILRKDFIIDEYQISEARSVGADAILLIASVLDTKRMTELAAFARQLGLETMVEIKNRAELDKVPFEYTDLVGVNNRNLEDFTVNIDTSFELANEIPADCVKVSESGLSKPKRIIELRAAGYQGFLIGTHFMKEPQPGKACGTFIKHLQKLNKKFDAKKS